MTSKKLSIYEKIINIVLDILIFIFGIILLISIYNGIQVKILGNDYSSFFGYSIFEVQTGSMADTINAGDWIVVKYSKSVELDDIITYEQDGEFITHRVIEAYKGTYVTMGDANTAKDDPISQDQIVGKVKKILPNFGIIRKTFFNPFVLVALIITLYSLSFVFKMNKKDKEKVTNERKIDIFMKNIIKKIQILIANLKKEHTKTSVKVDTLPSETKIEEVVSDTPEVKSVNVTNNEEAYNMEEIKEEAAKTDDRPEEDLEKTMYFRVIPVDKADIDGTNIEIPEEEVVAPKEKEVIEEEVDDESLIKHQLEMLQNKRKRFKNILDKVMFIKNDEINEIIDVLNNNEKYKSNEISIKDDFLKSYIDGKYYNYCGDVNVEYNLRNMTLKLNEVIDSTAQILIKQYKSSDAKYTDKVNKYANMFTLIMYLEQADSVLEETEPKKEIYKKKMLKYFRGVYITDVTLNNMINKILKIQRVHRGMISYSFKKLDTNMFKINFSPITGKKNLIALDLEHNIKFSKVYSDYIVDKTYKEGIIAEDKVTVLVNMLLVQIAKDMLNGEFKNKYVVYIPNSLYNKESKLNKLLALFGDEYAKNNIIILIRHDDIINNKKLIKKLRKDGYHFAITLDNVKEVKAKDISILYVADYLFMDKKAVKTTDIMASIPADLNEHIVYDDIASKVGNFGGE